MLALLCKSRYELCFLIVEIMSTNLVKLNLLSECPDSNNASDPNNNKANVESRSESNLHHTKGDSDEIDSLGRL